MPNVDQSMEFVRTLTAEHWTCLAGLIILAYWLLKTSLGTRALADSMPRRNNMPVYLPLIPLFIWFGPVPMVALAVGQMSQDRLADWQTAFLQNCVFIVGGLVTTTVILLLARAHFARRLRGFGLNVRTAAGDFFRAPLNLLAVWPLIMAAITITMSLGRHVWGQDYRMPQHQELELITKNPELPLRVTIVVAAVIVAPLLEELMFRGLVQTTIRSFLAAGHGAWVAIAMSSALFALMHANAGHWPALFVLSMGMGYTYEKSGSLFRPIFIHSFFNAASIAAALSQS